MAKEKIILRGKHLTIKIDSDGKEVLEWNWEKLEKETKKAISDFEKKTRKDKK